jgi:hypothetical protein
MELTDERKFEASMMRFKDQTELLRSLTAIDLRLFFGYITLQLVSGGWLLGHEDVQWFAKLGVSLVDFVLSLIASRLLHLNYMRRAEVVDTLRRIMSALQFDKCNVYLQDKTLDPETTFRPWRSWYQVGIWVAFLGVLVIMWGPKLVGAG